MPQDTGSDDTDADGSTTADTTGDDTGTDDASPPRNRMQDMDLYRERSLTLWKVGGPAIFLIGLFLLTMVELWMRLLGLYLLIVAATMTGYAYRPDRFDDDQRLNTVKNAVFLSVAVILTVAAVVFGIWGLLQGMGVL